MAKKLLFWFGLFPFAICVCCALQVLRLLGCIKVVGIENMPKKKESLLIMSPHESFWETAALYVIISPFYYFFHPKAIPWSTPDKENLCDKWWWLVLKPRSIPISRCNRREGVDALQRMISLLQSGYNIILFPEGGRTDKGTKFHTTPSGKRRIRELKNGIGSILCRSGCTVVTVWVEGSGKVWPIGKRIPRFWRKTVITIGQPVKMELDFSPDRDKVAAKTDWASQELLKVAAQGEG